MIYSISAVNGINQIQQTTKAGFCPRPGLLGALFGRSANTRSGPGAAADAPAGGEAPTPIAAVAEGNNDARREARREERRQQRQNERQARSAPLVRVARQTPADTTQNSPQANTRFLPGLGVPGLPGIKNPFCRDECFNDFDCPGNLKCCGASGDCRTCKNPVF